jgi:hypothetical protein
MLDAPASFAASRIVNSSATQSPSKSAAMPPAAQESEITRQSAIFIGVR